MNKNFNIGDLIKLKGLGNKTNINDMPVGLIIVDLGLDKYKIEWVDKEIAGRFALEKIMPGTKIELIK